MSVEQAPQSIDAEQSILGGILIDNGALDKVRDTVSGSDFYRYDHQRIFHHLVKIIDSGKPADMVTVNDSINASDDRDKTGGIAYLAALAVNTPSAHNVRRYAEIVREHATRRELQSVANEMHGLAAMGDPEKVRAQLIERAKAIKTNGKRGTDASVILLHGSEITPEPIDWLWEGFLARGKLHIIAGSPGTGKTTLALAFAATITAGGRWPDRTKTEPGNILIWSGEDDIRDTLLPRLIAMGADSARVYFVGDVRADGQSRPFDPARDMTALERKAAEIGDIRLLIVDPVVNAVSGDSHKNTETRRSLQPVVDLASRLDAVALGVSHFSKGTAGRDPVERVTGSIAFGALPRIVFAAAKTTDEAAPAKRVFVRSKSNIGPDGGGFGYDLEQTAVPGYPGLFASRVLWGNALEGTAKDLLASAEAVEEGERGATDEAKQFLQAELADGPVSSKAIQRAADDAGISRATLRVAKTALGIESERIGGLGDRGEWKWGHPKMLVNADTSTLATLPKMLVNPKGASQKETSTLTPYQHLRDERPSRNDPANTAKEISGDIDELHDAHVKAYLAQSADLIV